MPLNQTTELLRYALLSILDILLLLQLYRHIFGEPHAKRSTIYCQGALLMLFSTMLLTLVLAEGRPYSIPPFTVLLSFLFLPLYPSNRQKKMLFSTTLVSLSGLLLILGDFLLTPLQLHSLASVILHLLFWLLLKLIWHIGRYRNLYISSQLWLLLLSIAVSSIGMLCLIFYFAIIRDNPYQLTTEIPILTILLFINISLFVFFDRFSALFFQRREKTLLEQQLLMQRSHYRELEATHNQLRHLRHDMNNFIMTASQLAKQHGDSKTLISYLEQTTRQMDQIEQVISTGNENIDSVLNIKIADMNQNSIPFTTEIQIPSGLMFTFEQSVTILGNLLDNAIESSLTLPPENRQVSIKLRYAAHALFLKVENISKDITGWKKGLPLSTKNTDEMHGIGLKHVKEMIGDSGTINIRADSGSFQVHIILYDIVADFNRN